VRRQSGSGRPTASPWLGPRRDSDGRSISPPQGYPRALAVRVEEDNACLAAVKTGTVNMAKDIGSNMDNATVPTVSF
jgi:hypothetical protein